MLSGSYRLAACAVTIGIDCIIQFARIIADKDAVRIDFLEITTNRPLICAKTLSLIYNIYYIEKIVNMNFEKNSHKLKNKNIYKMHNDQIEIL